MNRALFGFWSLCCYCLCVSLCVRFLVLGGWGVGDNPFMRAFDVESAAAANDGDGLSFLACGDLFGGVFEPIGDRGRFACGVGVGVEREACVLCVFWLCCVVVVR